MMWGSGPAGLGLRRWTSLASVGGIRWLGFRRWAGDAAPLDKTYAANSDAISRSARLTTKHHRVRLPLGAEAVCPACGCGHHKHCRGPAGSLSFKAALVAVWRSTRSPAAGFVPLLGCACDMPCRSLPCLKQAAWPGSAGGQRAHMSGRNRTNQKASNDRPRRQSLASLDCWPDMTLSKWAGQRDSTKTGTDRLSMSSSNEGLHHTLTCCVHTCTMHPNPVVPPLAAGGCIFPKIGTRLI
jgi:hypothetical protein